ncbi:OmpA family protein [Clostridium sp. Cult1]|uniref:OmpA family protein n=1 Tax=Clostridium sp. Cult1 TaxID=2079002 RepID=UPI001F2BD7A5|nr:OmpA family protein [Clostridium sp. Cult1]MCF6463992.1 flagellar motor protein MotB [Clostridium sp. Cult1]
MILKNKSKENYIDESPLEYWMSFSDMMSSLLMIFILLLILSILQLSRQKELLIEKEDEVDKIIGIRQMIVAELREEFRDSQLEIDIDPETGSITFSEGVLFDYNAYIIKDTGKDYLMEFIPQYIKVLLNPKNKEYISEIIIEGHTDDQGSYMYNLELSQKRAFEVAKFILSEEFQGLGNKEDLQSILTANGRSFSNPIRDSEGNIIDESSRRVEFKFRLKDEEMIYKMKEMLEDGDA